MSLEDKLAELTKAVQQNTEAVNSLFATIDAQGVPPHVKARKEDNAASDDTTTEDSDVVEEKTPSKKASKKAAKKTAAKADAKTEDDVEEKVPFQDLAKLIEKLAKLDRDTAVAALGTLGVKRLSEVERDNYATAKQVLESALKKVQAAQEEDEEEEEESFV